MANNDIDAVLEATDIVSLISEYVDLKKEGKNYKGCCPFHDEKTPSFVVSPEKKIFNCFGCHKGGNAIKFVQEIENVDFKTALSKLADKANIKLNRAIEYKPQNNYEKYYNIFQTAIDFYAINLNATEKGEAAKQYLYKRGITDEAIELFNIGLSPNSYDSLYQVLKDKDYLELDMQDLALISKGNNDKYHDFFVNRIMFPIYDELGNPVAFSARIWDTNDKNQAKYINSAESIVFKKNSTLFNLHLAKKNINKMNRAILLEGQMDVIKAYMAGLTEAVASLSTSFTTNHATILKRYTNNVIICYDSDSAGINSSKKVINLLLNMGFNVKLVLLPDGLDPDEYYQKFGKASLKDYINNNIIDPIEYTYRVSFLNKKLDDNLEIENIKSEIFNILKRYNSNTITEKYLNKLSNDLNINFNALLNDFNNAITPQIDYIEPEIDINIVKPKPNKDYNNIAELRLIMYAKASKANASYIEKELGEYIIYLSDKVSNLWNKLIYDFYYNFEVFEEGTFIKLLSDDEMQFYSMLLDKMRQDKAFFNQDDMIDCIIKVKEVALKSKISELINKSNQEQDQKSRLKYSSEIFEIKKEIENIKKRRGRHGF